VGFRAGMIGLHSRDDNAIRLPAMTIQVNVRLFASLRERVGCGEAVLELPAGATAAEAWARLADGPLPDNTLVAVNREYTDAGHRLADGDELAFFPPVTGG